MKDTRKLFILLSTIQPIVMIKAIDKTEAMSKMKAERDGRTVDKWFNHSSFKIVEVTSIEELMPLLPEQFEVSLKK